LGFSGAEEGLAHAAFAAGDEEGGHWKEGGGISGEGMTIEDC
jgi:hypothetical protein